MKIDYSALRATLADLEAAEYLNPANFKRLLRLRKLLGA